MIEVGKMPETDSEIQFNPKNTAVAQGASLEFLDNIAYPCGKLVCLPGQDDCPYGDIRAEQEVQAFMCGQNMALVALRQERKSDKVTIKNKDETIERQGKAMSLDDMTGVYNKASFCDQISLGLEYASRKKQPLAIMMVDLDRFKEVNDTHGHDSGDIVIKEVASRMKQSVRDYDKIFRMGGDEFAILLGDIEDVKPKTLIERKKEIIDKVEAPIKISGVDSVTVGASIGVVEVSKAEVKVLKSFSKTARKYRINALLKEADVRMFAEKEKRGAGR